jgi:hypothetical protein
LPEKFDLAQRAVYEETCRLGKHGKAAPHITADWTPIPSNIECHGLVLNFFNSVPRPQLKYVIVNTYPVNPVSVILSKNRCYWRR